MISITCTNCKTVLTIDDAFAGGVCRCQHCGTIQTVPANAKHGDSIAGGSISGQSLGGSKVGLAREKVSGTGLDELADIVASSGLAGSGLTSHRLNRPAPTVTTDPAAAARAKRMRIAIISASVSAVFVAVVVIIALSSGRPAENTGAQPDGPVAFNDRPTAPPPVAKGPSYCGVPLPGLNVVYVIDRGSGSRDVLDLMKSVTLKSIATLGSEGKFQIILWDNGMDEALYPTTGLTYATDKKLDEARKFLDDIAAVGASDPKTALQKAYAQSPDVVVLATGKGADLSADDSTKLTEARGTTTIKTYTFSLGEGESDVLKSFAITTGGEYRRVTSNQLDEFAR